MTKTAIPGGIWSATPTPFTPEFQVDVPSVRRLVDHHVKMGVAGVMLAGTCGEGPWLRECDREALVRGTVEASGGRLRVAMQVTDNSAARVLDNAEAAARWGAEIAVVAQPFFFFNATPDRQLAFYREIVRRSPLPVGFYDRGAASPYVLPESHFEELLAEPRLIVVKDSSVNVARRDRYLAARRTRPELALFTGDEFTCAQYLQAGYDGALLGGGIFNGRLAVRILAAVRTGDFATAEKLQARMNDLMYRVYGGKKIECWMTGLKELLVQMKVFSHQENLLGYPLTETCRTEITAAVSGADGLGFRADLFGVAAAGAAG
jgi:4-hydroxy-tetrahydrodipicolinate synthase